MKVTNCIHIEPSDSVGNVRSVTTYRTVKKELRRNIPRNKRQDTLTKSHPNTQNDQINITLV